MNLQIGGHSSSFLSSADAERLESRSRKVEQQQVYARQLTEDSNVTTGHSNYQSDTRSGRGSFSAGNNRSPTGGSYGDNGSSNDPRGGVSSGESLFGVMSERDQNAIATAKKRVAQAEYYQQLKEVDSKRSDSNSLPSQSRTTLYRSREQRENDDLATSSRGRDYESSRQSRPRSNYDGDQNTNNGRGYQDQSYSLGAGPGYGSQNTAPQVRDRGDNELSSARRRQQDEYANALRSDSAVVPIADSYIAQRRSHHDREGPGPNRDGDRDNGYSSRQAGSDRDTDSQSMNRGGQVNDRPSERYQEREEREQPQYQDRGGREQARYQDREEREQPQYSDRGGREQPRYRERDEQESEMGQHRDRNQGRTDSSSTYSPPMESTYQGPGPRPGSGNVSRPDPRNGGYNSSQGMSYRNQEGYCDEEATQYDTQRRGSQISSPLRNHESNSPSGQYEPLSPGQQYKKQHLFGADPHGTVTRQTGPIAQSDNSGPVAGELKDFYGVSMVFVVYFVDNSLNIP